GVRIHTEHLGKDFDVDTLAVVRAVKAFDNECFTARVIDAFRQVADGGDIDQIDGGNVDAHHLGQRHHGKLVFRHLPEIPGGQFDDPMSADASGWDGQATRGVHDGGE